MENKIKKTYWVDSCEIINERISHVEINDAGCLVLYDSDGCVVAALSKDGWRSFDTRYTDENVECDERELHG